jgi:hypothetical protein
MKKKQTKKRPGTPLSKYAIRVLWRSGAKSLLHDDATGNVLTWKTRSAAQNTILKARRLLGDLGGMVKGYVIVKL